MTKKTLRDSKPIVKSGARPKAITREGSIFTGVACYVLDNGKRVITKNTMVSALSGGARERGVLGAYIEHLPNGSELLSSRANVIFVLPKGGLAHGVEASTVARMLKLYAEAWGAGALRVNQVPVRTEERSI